MAEGKVPKTLLTEHSSFVRKSHLFWWSAGTLFLLFQYRNNLAVTAAFSVHTFSWLPLISSRGSARGVPLCCQSGAHCRKGKDPGKGHFWFLSVSISSQMRYLVFFSRSSWEDHLIFSFQKARFSKTVNVCVCVRVCECNCRGGLVFIKDRAEWCKRWGLRTKAEPAHKWFFKPC